MKNTRSNTARPTSLPNEYVEKKGGTVAPNDLVWNAAEGTFESATENTSMGSPVDKTHTVATPAYWVTYDKTTGTVWGVGESPEESIQAAKFEAYGDNHGGIGYEFACWCEELNTAVCSETLYDKADGDGRLSLSDERLQDHVLST